MRGILQDVRHALRGFRRKPGFTAVVVATVALGVGANAAIFSVVDSILFRPLPIAHADRIVRLHDTRRSPDATGTLVPFLGVVALATGFVPARGVSRVDPIVALRQP